MNRQGLFIAEGPETLILLLRSSLQVRNRSSGRTSMGRSQRLVSDEDDENEDPHAKRQPNGAVKRYGSRQSAQEAAKRMRTDLDSSEDDDAGVAEEEEEQENAHTYIYMEINIMVIQ